MTCLRHFVFSRPSFYSVQVNFNFVFAFSVKLKQFGNIKFHRKYARNLSPMPLNKPFDKHPIAFAALVKGINAGSQLERFQQELSVSASCLHAKRGVLQHGVKVTA
jgi:hypothetical protein